MRDLILTLIGLLWHPVTELKVRHADIADELEHVLNNVPQAGFFISDFVEEQLLDVNITYECQRQIEAYQPWASSFDSSHVLTGRGPIIDRYVALRSSLWRTLILNDGWKPLHLGRLVTKPKDRFEYPDDNRRTATIVERRRLAEEKLELFWTTADRTLLRALAAHKGYQGLPRIKELLASFDAPKRTPEWAEPELERRGRGDQAAAAEATFDPIWELVRRTEASLSTSPDQAADKVKVKTRGTAMSVGSPQLPVDANFAREGRSGSKACIEVDSRNNKVFRMLFHQANNSELPGKLRWSEFARAMTSLGFRLEPLLGSIRAFRPYTGVAKGIDRAIIFHEPHDGEITFHTARFWGRRLTRNFDWDSSTFKLAG